MSQNFWPSFLGGPNTFFANFSTNLHSSPPEKKRCPNILYQQRILISRPKWKCLNWTIWENYPKILRMNILSFVLKTASFKNDFRNFFVQILQIIRFVVTFFKSTSLFSLIWSLISCDAFRLSPPDDRRRLKSWLEEELTSDAIMSIRQRTLSQKNNIWWCFFLSIYFVFIYIYIYLYIYIFLFYFAPRRTGCCRQIDLVVSSDYYLLLKK